MLPTLGVYVADCTPIVNFSWSSCARGSLDVDGEHPALQQKLNKVAKPASLVLARSSVHPWQSRIESPKRCRRSLLNSAKARETLMLCTKSNRGIVRESTRKSFTKQAVPFITKSQPQPPNRHKNTNSIRAHWENGNPFHLQGNAAKLGEARY